MATNSGDRHKGTNVIAQQVDLKKYLLLYLPVNSCAAAFSKEDYKKKKKRKGKKKHTQFLTCLYYLFKRQVPSKCMT
jgi:hypothetical protein